MLPQHQHNVLEHFVDEVGRAGAAGEIASHPRGIAGIERVKRLGLLHGDSTEEFCLIIWRDHRRVICFRDR
jgi:hypothetical protein